jgi:hypothetical protein
MSAKLKAPATIAKMKSHYRTISQTSNDPIERHVAYSMWHTLRWATEKSSGWKMQHWPHNTAKCIRTHLTPTPEEKR